VRQEGGFVFFDVKDSGAGIPEEIQDRIFESFFTTKAKGEGTGLGLSIIRSIVKEHDGELLLHTQLGKGTVFSVKFPMEKILLEKASEDDNTFPADSPAA
ncbi:MAG: HAMP domain-containing histidine kinase, partial [Silvanigrellaceae bacterium]|nr:HAMP domain-containing histidine kinase [Silvanigrellaceae bacterium]